MLETFKTNLGPLSTDVIAAGVLCVALALLWVSVSRARHSGRVAAGVIASALLVAWFAATWVLARQEFFKLHPDTVLPAIPFAIALPAVGAYVLMRRSSVAMALVDALPLPMLTFAQIYRVAGFVFLGLWAAGRMPGEFALPAGIGDVMVGLMSIPAGFAAASNESARLDAVRRWNYSGLLDFAAALMLGLLTSPGLFHVLALDRPNELVSSFPLVMIPVFAVPTSIILHMIGLMKLQRMTQQNAVDAGPVPAVAVT